MKNYWLDVLQEKKDVEYFRAKLLKPMVMPDRHYPIIQFDKPVCHMETIFQKEDE